ICYVPRTTSLRAEYRRKVRTIARGIETLLSKRSLLDPTQYGSFSWKLLSHKVCRWLVPTFALPGLLGLAMLAPVHEWARLLLWMAAAGIAAVIAGAMWPANRAMPRLLR